MFYVYEWYIVESGEVIYVGKGCRRRYMVRKHNERFNEMIQRFECKSRIIRYFESEKDAFLYEAERVAELKKIGQCVANIYMGGFGGKSESWTPERTRWHSENNVMKSIEQRRRMSERNPMKNPEVSKRVGATKRRPVVIDGHEYDSILSAAKECRVAPDTVMTWVKRGYNTDYKPCRYADENQKIFECHRTNSKAVVIDGVRYESVRAAATEYGVWPETIIRAAKNSREFKGHTCEYDNH